MITEAIALVTHLQSLPQVGPDVFTKKDKGKPRFFSVGNGFSVARVTEKNCLVVRSKHIKVEWKSHYHDLTWEKKAAISICRCVV